MTTDQQRAVAIGAVALATAATLILVLTTWTAIANVSFIAPPRAELLAACQRFVTPEVGLASLLALTLGVLAVAVFLRGSGSAWRQIRATRRLVRHLSRCPTGPGSVALVRHTTPMAFCTGLLRPRCYLSTAALDALSDAELKAVLAHEAHHVQRRDPLRFFAARVATEALFFLPIMRSLAGRHTALSELAADEAALRQRGPRPLASALLRLEAASPESVGIAPERVDALLGRRTSWRPPVVPVAVSMVALLALVTTAVHLTAAGGDQAANMPLMAAGLCMWAMTTVPALLLAVGLFRLARLRFPAHRGRSGRARLEFGS